MPEPAGRSTELGPDEGGGAGGVAEVVEAVLAGPPRLGAVRLVAVDGPSGSGKTVFAAELAGELRRRRVQVALVSTDLLATWENPFDWWPRWEAGLLGPLAAGRAGRLRAVEWPGGVPTPGPLVDIAVPQVLVTEGVSSGRRAVRDRLTLLIWVEEPDPVLRRERAIRRDGEAVRAPLVRWQVQEAEHFAREDTRGRADLRRVGAAGPPPPRA